MHLAASISVPSAAMQLEASDEPPTCDQIGRCTDSYGVCQDCFDVIYKPPRGTEEDGGQTGRKRWDESALVLTAAANHDVAVERNWRTCFCAIPQGAKRSWQSGSG